MSPRRKRKKVQSAKTSQDKTVKPCKTAIEEALIKSGYKRQGDKNNPAKVKVTYGKASVRRSTDAASPKGKESGKQGYNFASVSRKKPVETSSVTGHGSSMAGYREQRVVGKDGRTTIIRRHNVTNVSGKNKPMMMRTSKSENKQIAVKGRTPLDPCDGFRIEARTTVNMQLFNKKSDHKYLQLKPVSLIGMKNSDDPEIELVVGMDFGTAFTKVIVQEPDSGMSWAIPFTDSGENPYLIPSRVFSDGDEYMLREKGVCYGNLKVPLLLEKPKPGLLLNTVAFIGLILRHVRNWTYKYKQDELAGMKPAWIVNLGLPARNLENTRLVSNFRILLLAGMLLAHRTDETVTAQDVKKALITAQKGVRDGADTIHMKKFGDVNPDDIGIYPELSAQIFGYVRSDKWDRNEPKFMLVDVGGGTVDASIFNVTRDNEGEYRFSFFRSAVEQLGAYILHLRRLEWLSECADRNEAKNLVKDLAKLHDADLIPAVIPSNVKNYMKYGKLPERTIDTEFYAMYADMLWGDIILMVKNKKDPHSDQWGKLPFLLCGGGSEVALYKEFKEKIKNSNSSVRLRDIAMDRPEKLDAPGLPQHQFQRLSVAYGLSFLEVGEHINPDRIEDIVDAVSEHKLPGEYTTKEMI